MLENHIENLKLELDAKVADGLMTVAYLKRQENTDPWELGMTEGQLLTFEFCRSKLEEDDLVRGEMLEATIERLVAERE